MNRYISSIIEPVALGLRRAPLRQPILKILLRHDNFLRRWISFFSLEKGLHPKHRLTSYHAFFTDNTSPSDTVLDIGCGGGHLAYDVAQTAKQVIGIDISRHYLAASQRYTNQSNLSFVHGDVTTYQFQTNFNVVILSNVLEHIADRVGLLKKIKPLAPKLLIRVPMIDRDWLVLLKQELGVEHRLDPTHTIEYTESIFRRELAQANLVVKQLAIRFGEIYCVAES